MDRGDRKQNSSPCGGDCPCLEHYNGVNFDAEYFTDAGKFNNEGIWAVEFRNIGSTVAHINGVVLLPAFVYITLAPGPCGECITLPYTSDYIWKPDLLSCERDVSLYKIKFAPLSTIPVATVTPLTTFLTQGNMLEIIKKYKAPVPKNQISR